MRILRALLGLRPRAPTGEQAAEAPTSGQVLFPRDHLLSDDAAADSPNVSSDVGRPEPHPSSFDALSEAERKPSTGHVEPPILVEPDAGSLTDQRNDPKPGPSAGRIKGAVDGFRSPNVITGWALDATDESEAVTIRLLLDGRDVAAAITMYSRPDVPTAATNKAGFRLESESLIDARDIVDGRLVVLAGAKALHIHPPLREKLKASLAASDAIVGTQL